MQLDCDLDLGKASLITAIRMPLARPDESFASFKVSRCRLAMLQKAWQFALQRIATCTPTPTGLVAFLQGSTATRWFDLVGDHIESKHERLCVIPKDSLDSFVHLILNHQNVYLYDASASHFTVVVSEESGCTASVSLSRQRLCSAYSKGHGRSFLDLLSTCSLSAQGLRKGHDPSSECVYHPSAECAIVAI